MLIKMDQKKIEQAHAYIQERIDVQPEFGLVLGSGLGVLADDIEDQVTIAYEQIPHFPISTVSGHEGKLVIGTLAGQKVIAMQGRFHFYEGYSMPEVTFPIHVMRALGIHTIFLTNAAGGVNDEFNPGDLMVIRDHINQTGTNPLIGPNNDTIGPRFPDLSEVYSKESIEHVLNSAEELSIPIKTGVYVGNTGPSYETPAEVNMIRMIGGDAVGMSTVAEAIVARYIGLRIVGISCITNMAAGMLDEPLMHEDVVATAKKAQHQFIQLIKHTLQSFPK